MVLVHCHEMPHLVYLAEFHWLQLESARPHHKVELTFWRPPCKAAMITYDSTIATWQPHKPDKLNKVCKFVFKSSKTWRQTGSGSLSILTKMRLLLLLWSTCTYASSEKLLKLRLRVRCWSWRAQPLFVKGKFRNTSFDAGNTYVDWSDLLKRANHV